MKGKTEVEKMTIKEYWAVVYRCEMKKTMRSQLEIVQYLRKVMKESDKIKTIFEDANKPRKEGEKEYFE